MGFRERKAARIAAGFSQTMFDVCWAPSFSSDPDASGLTPGQAIASFKSRKEADAFVALGPGRSSAAERAAFAAGARRVYASEFFVRPRK